MIAALMELTNYLDKVEQAGAVSSPRWTEAVDTLLLLLAPTAPHLAEELWQHRGHEYSIHNQRWPQWDDELAKDEEITLVVQVNGKLRDRLTIPASTPLEDYVELARQSKRIQAYLEGKEIVKTITVPGTANFVVR